MEMGTKKRGRTPPREKGRTAMAAMEIGKYIQQLRRQKGLTQEQTARILGVSQVQVSRREKKLMQYFRKELLED